MYDTKKIKDETS